MVNRDEELARAVREAEILTAENQRLQLELREATEKYAAMRSSLSWRITAPLRAALDLALKFRRAPAATKDPLELNNENYRCWIAEYDTLTAAARAAIRSAIDGLSSKPLLVLALIVNDPPDEALRQTIQSIRRQLYREWELHLIDENSTAPHVARALSACGDDPRVRIQRVTDSSEIPLFRTGYIAHLEPGDVLTETALYEIAAEILEYPDAGLVYSDEDELDGRGERCNPRFKTDWNPDLALEQDYLGQLTFCNASKDATQVRHIPAVLCHRTLAKTGLLRSRPIYPERPKVSIIIPTRDRADLLERCVEGLLHRTNYPDLEILVMDNGSKEERTHRLFSKYAAHANVRVLPYPGAFNWSAMNNKGARAASGDVLLFLNNDTDVMEENWLAELASQAARPEIGAAGAKLLFADGTVQHAGIWLGPGVFARHLLRLSHRDDPGYLGQLALTRNLSAVTGACLAIRRAVFEEVGGFDETFPVSYSDLDLCLKLIQRNYRVLWTPHSQLLHLESASRGNSEWRWREEEADRNRFVERWKEQMDRDPFFNPNLDLIGEEKLALAFPPRRRRRWQ